jgi:hypothetical protein
MKHRLYEGWIMAQDELTPDQRRDLEAHLEECEACRRLAEARIAVDQVLTPVKMTEPMPGFVLRWKARAGERRMRVHRRQTSTILGLLSFGAIALFLPLVLQTILVLISPEDLLFDLARALVDWISFLKLTGELIATFFSTLYSTMPVVFWLMIMGFAVGVVISWGYALLRLGYLPIRERS